MSGFRHDLMVVLGAISLAACAPTEPNSGLPTGAVELHPSLAYQAWFQKTETCSGMSGVFQNVQWYVVPGVETFSTDQGPKVGMWLKTSRGDAIVLAGNYQEHEMVVRHEMLHSLLRQAGHPTTYFVDRCQLTWETWLAG